MGFEPEPEPGVGALAGGGDDWGMGDAVGVVDIACDGDGGSRIRITAPGVKWSS
jgi:hypothetical protein